MDIRPFVIVLLAASICGATLAGAAPPVATPSAPPATAEADRGRTAIGILVDEVERLRVEAMALREQLAAARLEAATAQRELEELRTFIEDHDRLGPDFDAYRAVLATAEAAARREAIERRQAEREAERVERRARRTAALEERERQRAERERAEYYRRRGFSPLGLDVHLSRMSFAYGTGDASGRRVDYAPGLGHYLRLYPARTVDYSSMTFSGSILSAAAEVRNVGVAITFFDDAGHQVGQEIVQVNHARPDVPYPFTATVVMATDRPFASSSQHVLYADVADLDEGEQ